MINSIKRKLSNYLNEIFNDLSDEDIVLLAKIKEDGLKPIINGILKSRNFNSVNLLNIAYALNTDNETIKNKIKEDNLKIINELSQVTNELVYSDIIHKFYEPQNIKNLKVANTLSALDTYHLEVPNIQSVPFINFANRIYINPYNNAAFEIKTKVEQGSNISSIKDPNKRKITATVTMALMSQNNWLEHSGKDNAGLNESFTQEQISKMGVEFILFHELSHASARKYMLEGKDDESFADICGIVQVIKNNDLSQEDAIKFVNRIILYRSQPSSIRYYSTDFENNSENTPTNRYHFTQDSLMCLREMMPPFYTQIKEMSVSEHAIFASNLVFAQNTYDVSKNINDRLGLYGKDSTNVFLDDLLATETDYLKQVAESEKISVEKLIERIKLNISDDPRKILDLNLHILYKHDEKTLYQINSFFPFDNEIIMRLHKRSVDEYKEVNLARNFTYAELVKELDTKQIKRKPKLS